MRLTKNDAEMKLFRVTYRADISFRGKQRTDMEVILVADNEEDARTRADVFILKYGLYHETGVAGSRPRFDKLESAAITALFYNGKFFETPEDPFGRAKKGLGGEG